MADRPHIDRRFLSVHPATALWWQQRETCRKCTHVLLSDKTRGGDAATVWLCEATVRRKKNGVRDPRGGGSGYCIDARLPGAACGPDAVLFQEKDR